MKLPVFSANLLATIFGLILCFSWSAGAVEKRPPPNSAGVDAVGQITLAEALESNPGIAADIEAALRQAPTIDITAAFDAGNLKATIEALAPLHVTFHKASEQKAGPSGLTKE